MRRPELTPRQGTTCQGSPAFAASIGPRFAARVLVALLTAAGALSGSAVAQDVAATDPPAEGEAVPSDTLVARFDLPRHALDDVANSVELIAALREHLTIDVAMPVDAPLMINLHGSAGRRAGGQGPDYRFGLSPLGVGYEGETPLEGFPYALAVRESHGADFPPDGDEWAEFDADDWDEDEAWNRLVEALDVGLTQSTAEFGRPGESGHADLAVTDIHLREFTLNGPADSAWADFGGCCDDLDDRADPWIAASLGSGSDGETLFVAETGFVEITSMEPSVRGRFEIVGWRGDGVNRGEEEMITGSFEAAPGAR